VNRSTTALTIAAGVAGLLFPVAGSVTGAPDSRPQTGPAATGSQAAAGSSSAAHSAAAQSSSAASSSAASSSAASSSAGSAGQAHRGAVRAVLRLADGTPVGSVAFHRAGRDATLVAVRLRLPQRTGAGSSFHGFHVHANNNPANGNGCIADPAQPAATWFVSADGHYTEPGQVHGQHHGDLPALYLTSSRVAATVFVTDRFRPADVIGRAVIVHARPDNFGNVPVGSAPTEYTPNSPAATTLTENTGNAGERIACGVIRRR
jgi:Cu-Zn family superoxide dismutase